MAPPSSVPANAAAVAGRGGSECRICPNPRLTAVAGVRPTPSFYPFILLSFLSLPQNSFWRAVSHQGYAGENGCCNAF